MLCAYLMSSASSLVHEKFSDAFLRIESTNAAAFLCRGEFWGMPTALRNGFPTSWRAVATERNSGQKSTVTFGFFFWSARVDPGVIVDLITAIFPLPTKVRAASTMPKSKPLGVEGVGTATKTTSQSLILSLLARYGSSSE